MCLPGLYICILLTFVHLHPGWPWQAIDEEDAVLLYRCKKLAETWPVLLEACDLRRAALEESLTQRTNASFHTAKRRLTAIGDAAVAAAATSGLRAHASHTWPHLAQPELPAARM